MKKQTTKPRLWKYKSGKKKGKLRPASKRYLSYKLKTYYFQKKQQTAIPKQQKKAIQKQTLLIEPTKETTLIKIRKQVCENFRADYPPYYVSIRAMTIHQDINEQGLMLALIDGKRQFQRDYGVMLNAYNLDYTGLSKQQISKDEDKILSDNKIVVEVFFAYFQKTNQKMLKYYYIN
jgi:hypothetical protein